MSAAAPAATTASVAAAGVTLTAEEVQARVDDLAAWLEKDPNAMEWARLKVEGTSDEAAAAEVARLETARWDLTNRLLKPVVKAAIAEAFGRAAREYLASFPQLEAVVRATLPFDRANALLCMKLARDDPDCPRGFMWITEGDLRAYTHPRDTGVALGAPHFGDVVQTHSIAKAYVTVADVTASSPNAALCTYIRTMTRPMAPAWMGLPLPGPETLV